MDAVRFVLHAVGTGGRLCRVTPIQLIEDGVDVEARVRVRQVVHDRHEQLERRRSLAPFLARVGRQVVSELRSPQVARSCRRP